MKDKTLKILLGIIAVNLTFLTVRDVGLFPTDNAPAEENPFLQYVTPDTDASLSVEEGNSFTFEEALGRCATITDIAAGELRSREHHRQMITAHFEITDHLNRIQQDMAFFRAIDIN
ncbi:hypothetical protein OAL54_01540 [Gammaproteobacteria bacterium]|nr:hypothetical protein [Gammaproteobacteria bacterium]